MPTVSSATHKRGASSPELQVHKGFELRKVDVVTDARVRPEWLDVLDTVAAHDLLLASGHLSAEETVIVFTEARRRGVQRLMVNHPKMAFLGWNDLAAHALQALGAFLELGILPDLLGRPDQTSLHLIGKYPSNLLVFGSDLGHAHHPTPAQAAPGWLADLEQRAGAHAAVDIMTTNGRKLLMP